MGVDLEVRAGFRKLRLRDNELKEPGIVEPEALTSFLLFAVVALKVQSLFALLKIIKPC